MDGNKYGWEEDEDGEEEESNTENQSWDDLFNFSSFPDIPLPPSPKLPFIGYPKTEKEKRELYEKLDPVNYTHMLARQWEALVAQGVVESSPPSGPPAVDTPYRYAGSGNTFMGARARPSAMELAPFPARPAATAPQAPASTAAGPAPATVPRTKKKPAAKPAKADQTKPRYVHRKLCGCPGPPVPTDTGLGGPRDVVA